MKYNFKKQIIALALMASPMGVYASGYHFGAQSVSGMSTANASEVEAADASTIFHNPAGLTYLPAQITGNMFLVVPNVRYKNAKGNYLSDPLIHIEGNDGGKISENAVVPHLYGAMPINDKISAGLGIYIPFASGTTYPLDSILRYNVNKTSLTTYAINPTVAFKVGQNHSIGVGFIAQYMDAQLRQFADFAPAFQSQGLPVPSGMADGYGKVSGTDWGYGYNLGWMWDINDNMRVGMNYRSKIDTSLEGDAHWILTGPALASPQAEAAVRAAGYAADERVRVNVTTPESLSFQGMWRINPKWTAFGDVTWTRHSRFNTLDIEFSESKVVPDAVNPKGNPPQKHHAAKLRPHWRDTWKFAIGTAYQYSEPLQLRAGLSYDQTPVRNSDERLATMPDNDRITLGVGAQYDLNKNNTIGLSYAYMRVVNASANINGYCGGSVAIGPGATTCVSSRTSSSADFKSDAHILGLQYTYKF